MCGATYLAPWLNRVLGWQGLGTTALEAPDKVDEIENSDSGHIEFPISRANENSTYDAISFQTFCEFYLVKDDWNAMSHLDKDNINHMEIGWTNVIADKFSEISSICGLKFKHFWFKKRMVGN